MVTCTGFEPIIFIAKSRKRFIFMISREQFRLDYYFVLYDLNDNVVCYFDNFAELSKIINYPSWKLARRFEIFGNLINVTIDNKDYKLFATCDTNNSLSLKKCLK